jgi:hypothetical protein
MERVLADKSAAAPRTMKHRVATFVVTGLRYMPSGRQAPAGVVPGTGSPSTIVQTIFANLYSMDAQLAEVEKTKGRSVRVQHPILGPLTVPQWRKFHWVHTSHHMKQIARLKEMQSRS